MYRCLFAFFLLYTHNFVSSLPTSTNNGSVSSWLAELAQRCDSPFIKTQVNNHIEDCKIPSSPFREKQFECMLFYDINTRLCDAIATKKINIDEEKIAKINGSLNINKFCGTAKDLSVSQLAEYPSYKGFAEKIFFSTMKCVKFCGVDDILLEDSNFYCKYFKWGSDLLAFNKTDSTGDIFVPPGYLEEQKPKTKSDNAVVQSVEPPPASGFMQSESSKIKLETHPQEKTNIPTNKDSSAPQLQTGNVHLTSQQNTSPETTTKTLKDVTSKGGKVPTPHESRSNMTVYTLPSGIGEKREESYVDQNEGPKPGNIGKLKNNDMDADYQDSDEPREQFLDQVADDRNDPEIKPNLKPMNGSPQKARVNDLFTNAMQDNFTQEDDHFFPFFLTAIILIVLLYVLYHNKTKVMKVLLGLIVEGRQSNRRRNSRGHAYRRLDTLEQAMSTNSSAPPSKIIY